MEILAMNVDLVNTFQKQKHLKNVVKIKNQSCNQDYEAHQRPEIHQTY